MPEIKSYHAHVYFDEATEAQARDLCNKAGELFGVPVGRMHTRPVGPHPMWSCQLTVSPDDFARVIPWLALNRNGLVIFTHPETGDVIADHANHAIWMGKVMPLDLDALR